MSWSIRSLDEEFERNIADLKPHVVRLDNQHQRQRFVHFLDYYHLYFIITTLKFNCFYNFFVN